MTPSVALWHIISDVMTSSVA